MAVAEMRKLNLVAMAYDKDALLNVLQKTNAADIRLHSERENTFVLSAAGDELREYLSEAEEALSYLCSIAEQKVKELKSKELQTEIPPEGFEISYSEFMSAGGYKAEADATIAEVKGLTATIKALGPELTKIVRLRDSAKIYSAIKLPFNSYADSAHSRFKLGIIPVNQKVNFENAIQSCELAAYSVVALDSENALVFVACHKSAFGEVEGILQSFGFSVCPFNDGRTGKEVLRDFDEEARRIREEIAVNEARAFELRHKIRLLKIYCDYVGFELEKQQLSEKLRATERTFLLEGYVPKDDEELVKEALNSFNGSVYFEFSDPSEDENPPTLLRNNAIVKNFEAVTNMYSPPNSRELDPNAVMAFFYSLFLGFIMADMGYGLLMLAGGGFLWYKNRARGGMIGRLGGVFAIGGIFTIIWGVLFNSLFGFSVLPFKVMPDLQGEEMSWSLAGINVPALLVISMLIGVAQLFAGYLCLAVQDWRRGKILDGIFDGVVWALFSVGVELAIAGFVDQFNASALQLIGGIIAGASLLIAIFTAGRHEKLLGKFTKGFSAAYGVINYASDILSYARLYGLMLAGAVIAEIITDNSVALMQSGSVAFIILGVVIMVVGHIFNLAIGLLGAYIHDARLQYVEFYGRFYEGEGELFTPLGSQHKHVYVLDENGALGK